MRGSLKENAERKKVGRPCKVCRAHETGHPRCEDVRPLVDAGHSRGVTDAELARRVAAMCHDWPRKDVPSVSSIRNHVSFHVTESVRLARSMAMERMRQFGETDTLLAEQFLEPIVDVTFMLAMAARDGVASGRIVPKDVSDVLKVVEAWARFRPTAESEGISREEHDADIATLIEAARRHMDRDQYANFLEHLKAVGREPRPGGARE
jgi:hypothetical protein